ncbi:MAG: hypothetical protein VKK05_02425 [Synechococcus sp.]|jgi:hypothetical protein|nr:hypothetical protein [Synechococcus sp.]
MDQIVHRDTSAPPNPDESEHPSPAESGYAGPAQDPVLCSHCGRTASNGISCQGSCVADSGY